MAACLAASGNLPGCLFVQLVLQQQDWQDVAHQHMGRAGLTVCVCVLQRNLMVAKHLVKARASDTPTPISMFGPDR